ncbi:MAG: hypothetical protein HRT54_13020 [Colwellia sp.]|nr:hypothetical protein [Colwellia sp.]
MDNVFELEDNTTISQNGSYVKAYPHMLSYCQGKTSFDESDFVILSHMVYGWMPTIIALDKNVESACLKTGAALLTKAKKDGVLSEQELKALKLLVNNSIVGVSKLLHFVNPTKFPIWDSRIYQFCYRKKSYSQANNIKKYLQYIELLNELIKKNVKSEFFENINLKLGYKVSKLRAIELVMFLNSPKF